MKDYVLDKISAKFEGSADICGNTNWLYHLAFAQSKAQWALDLGYRMQGFLLWGTSRFWLAFVFPGSSWNSMLCLSFSFFFFFFFSKLFPRTCVEKDFPILFCQLSLPDQSMKPQLAAPELATNNPTLTTVALEKPFCMFDSSLHPNKSYAIYLYVMKSSGKYQALFHL